VWQKKAAFMRRGVEKEKMNTFCDKIIANILHLRVDKHTEK
jgi:hypothetical protein